MRNIFVPLLIIMMIKRISRVRLCPCCKNMLIALATTTTKMSLVQSFNKSTFMRTGRSPSFFLQKVSFELHSLRETFRLLHRNFQITA